MEASLKIRSRMSWDVSLEPERPARGESLGCRRSEMVGGSIGGDCGEEKEKVKKKWRRQ